MLSSIISRHKDKARNCSICNIEFKLNINILTNVKVHQCKRCERYICYNCGPDEEKMTIHNLNDSKKHRVCIQCKYDKLFVNIYLMSPQGSEWINMQSQQVPKPSFLPTSQQVLQQQQKQQVTRKGVEMLQYLNQRMSLDNPQVLKQFLSVNTTGGIQKITKFINTSARKLYFLNLMVDMLNISVLFLALNEVFKQGKLDPLIKATICITRFNMGVLDKDEKTIVQNSCGYPQEVFKRDMEEFDRKVPNFEASKTNFIQEQWQRDNQQQMMQQQQLSQSQQLPQQQQAFGQNMGNNQPQQLIPDDEYQKINGGNCCVQSKNNDLNQSQNNGNFSSVTKIPQMSDEELVRMNRLSDQQEIYNIVSIPNATQLQHLRNQDINAGVYLNPSGIFNENNDIDSQQRLQQITSNIQNISYSLQNQMQIPETQDYIKQYIPNRDTRMKYQQIAYNCNSGQRVNGKGYFY